MNIEAGYNQVAKDLTELYKQVIRDKKLVKTGRLLNSIKWGVKQSPNGFTLQMMAEDYFSDVDKQNGISKTVFASAKFAEIKKQIAKLTNLYLIQELKKV